VGATPLTYDANANLAGDSTHTYVHNALAQLVSVTTPSARCRSFMQRRETGTLFP